MNEHETVRTLLPLAASGDLAPADLRRVQAHLARCGECRNASDDFASLAGALRDVPTPQPREELVAHVRKLAALSLERKRAWENGRAMFGLLVAASWAVALLTWPMLRAAAAWLLTGWDMPEGGIVTTLAVYSFVGLLPACASAIAVGMRARAVGRTK